MEKYIPVLSTSIADTRFRGEGKNMFCDLTVKVNLSNFEEQYLIFTPAFIAKVIGEHLPTVRTILNYEYSYDEPIVAQYYIQPGCAAKVLKFNRDYYENFHKVSDKYLANQGDTVSVKNMVKVKGDECVTCNYCQTFTVTGKATCHADDIFGDETGRNIAEARAIIKATNRINGLYGAIMNRVDKMHKSLEDGIDDMNYLADKAGEVLDKFIN